MTILGVCIRKTDGTTRRRPGLTVHMVESGGLEIMLLAQLRPQVTYRASGQVLVLQTFRNYQYCLADSCGLSQTAQGRPRVGLLTRFVVVVVGCWTYTS